MQEISETIQQMSDEQLRELMELIRQRYAEDFPMWEVVYVAVHKDPALRKEELDRIVKLLYMGIS